MKTVRPSPKPDLLGHFGSLSRILLGDNQVIRRQPPLLTILLGHQVVNKRKKSLKHLSVPAGLKADYIIGGDRLLDRHGRLSCRGLVVAARIVIGKEVRLLCKARVLIVVKVDARTICTVLDETVFFVMTVVSR